jgi:hypothetical protein
MIVPRMGLMKNGLKFNTVLSSMERLLSNKNNPGTGVELFKVHGSRLMAIYQNTPQKDSAPLETARLSPPYL